MQGTSVVWGRERAEESPLLDGWKCLSPLKRHRRRLRVKRCRRRLRVKRLTAVAEPGIIAPEFDHAENISALATRPATQFIHQGAHQEHAPAAEAKLRWIELRNGRQIKRFAFIDDLDFNAVRPKLAMDVELGVGIVAVRVADDVTDGFVDGDDNAIGGSLIEPARLTYCFHEGASDGQNAQITWQRQG
jgi:hypothetical protein